MIPIHRRRNRQSGVTLVEILVTAAIGGVLLIGIAASYEWSSQDIKRSNDAFDLETLRFTMRTSFSCKATFATHPNGICAGGTKLALLDHSNRQLIALGGSKLGKVLLETRCTGRPREIMVFYYPNPPPAPPVPFFKVPLGCPASIP